MSSILIVEDELILQDVYKLVLESDGYDVTVAGNGLDGLQRLKELRPDLVLLDIFMPVMDGREFLRNFDKDAYPDTKIVVYTNLSDGKTKAEMLELGADEFILKSSMTPQDLTDLAHRFLDT